VVELSLVVLRVAELAVVEDKVVVELPVVEV
jgi:hypothetical protein